MTSIGNTNFHKYYRPFGYPTIEAQPLSVSLVSSVATVFRQALPATIIGGYFGGVYPGAVLGGIVGVAATGCAKVIQALSRKKTLASVKEDHLLGKYQNANVQLLSASSSYAAKKALIASAKTSIEIIGSYAGGVHFQEILDLLEDKMKTEVNLRVHILFCPDMSTKEDFTRVASLKKQYPLSFEYCITHAKLSFSAPHTRENHSKLLIVDEKYFVLGGTSIFSQLNNEKAALCKKEPSLTMASYMLEKSVKDMDVAGKGESLAKTMRQQFYTLYQIYEMRSNPSSVNKFFHVTGNKGCCLQFDQAENLYKNVKVKFLVAGPEHGNQNPITSEYIQRIERAKNSINLAHLYFWPSERIKKALFKKNGQIPITLLTNGVGQTCSITRSAITHSARGNYDLVSEVYESETREQLFHMKVATFDQSHTLIGSYNLSEKSEFDYEIAVVIKDDKVTSACKKSLEEIKTDAKRLSSKTLKDRKCRYKPVAALVTPLMKRFF